MSGPWHHHLLDDGWIAATDRFWEAPICFYDLGAVKTVILFGSDDPTTNYAESYYWKHGEHSLPDYLPNAEVELRRYKLHHSMNALLWHDHGDRPIWPC